MKWHMSWTAVCVAGWLGQFSPEIAPAAAQVPPDSPIVLQFQERPIFRGPHENSVTAIAFSPDGATVGTGAHDGYLRLWDAATGRLKSIHGEDATRGIQGLAFSPDGRRVAVVGTIFGKQAVLWDVASGRIVRDFAESPAAADSAAGSAAAAEFVYKGQPINFRTLHAVAFSPDGRILATAGDDVVLHDAESGRVMAKLEHPGKGVNSLAFSVDGKTLVTAANDRKVRQWRVPAGVLEATLDGPTQPLSSVAVSADGTRIVATSSGARSILSRDQTPVGYLWIWDGPIGRARKIEIGNVDVLQVAFVAPTTVVVAAGQQVLSLDLHGDDASRPRTVCSHSGDVLALAVSPDGGLLASGGADRTVGVVDVSTGKSIHRLPGLTDIVSSVATSPDGKQFATATIDVRFSTRVPSTESSFAARFKTYFSDDGNRGRPQPSEVRIWSTRDGRLQALLPLPANQVTAIDYLPNSDLLAVAGWLPGKGGMLALWDVKGPKHVRDFALQTAEVLSVAAAPDGRALASGDADGNVDLWDVQSGAKTRSHKLDHAVEAVTFSADGKLLATGGADQTVRIFDASSGAVVKTLKCGSYIESLDFSPDASMLVAGTRTPGLELWDLRPAHPVARSRPRATISTGCPAWLRFLPTGASSWGADTERTSRFSIRRKERCTVS